MTSAHLRYILYTKPSITELEVQYATDAATNGWGKHCYDYIIDCITAINVYFLMIVFL